MRPSLTFRLSEELTLALIPLVSLRNGIKEVEQNMHMVRAL